MATRRVITTNTTRRVPAEETVVVDEMSDTRAQRAVPYILSAEFIYWVLGIIEGLLAIRFFFRLAGANPVAGFVQFIYGITNVLMAPFFAIFPTARVERSVFEWSILVAMIVYLLIAWTILKLVDMFYTADQVD